jgi:hypothetical protein
MQAADEPLEESERVHSQDAALWLLQVVEPLDIEHQPWIADFIEAYGDWTLSSNGHGLTPDSDVDQGLIEWNDAFYSVLVRAIPVIGPAAAKHWFEQVTALPERQFFDISACLVRCLDVAYFADRGVDLATALDLRARLASRLQQTSGWRRESGRLAFSVEMHIAPAIATLFMNEYNPFSSTTCYLLEKGIDRVEPFLDTMRSLMGGPVFFLASLTLNLLEVSPRPAHAGFLLTSVQTWLDRAPDEPALWVDQDVGARIARWLEAVSALDPSLRSSRHSLRPIVDDVLARLVRIGVAEAHRVEALFALASPSGTSPVPEG